MLATRPREVERIDRLMTDLQTVDLDVDSGEQATARLARELIAQLLEVSGDVKNHVYSAKCIGDGEVRGVR
jgi:hypothetical protein